MHRLPGQLAVVVLHPQLLLDFVVGQALRLHLQRRTVTLCDELDDPDDPDDL